MIGAMTPCQRMAAILDLLYRAGDRPIRSQELWDAIPDYQAGAESGRRQYRHDIRALVRRGLVTTDLTTRWTPNRTGVRRRFIGKPEDWRLTTREHAALRMAVWRHRTVPPPPTTEGRDQHGTSLDVAMDAVRILEQHGDWTSIGDVAS